MKIATDSQLVYVDLLNFLFTFILNVYFCGMLRAGLRSETEGPMYAQHPLSNGSSSFAFGGPSTRGEQREGIT